MAGLPENPPPPYSTQVTSDQGAANAYAGVMSQISGMPEWKDTMRIPQRQGATGERTLLDESFSGNAKLPTALAASKVPETEDPEQGNNQPQGGELPEDQNPEGGAAGGSVPYGRSFSNFMDNINADNQSTPEAKPGRRVPGGYNLGPNGTLPLPGGYRLGNNGTLIPGTPRDGAKGALDPRNVQREEWESFHTAQNNSEEIPSESARKLAQYLGQLFDSRAKTPGTPNYWDFISRRPGADGQRILNLRDQRFEQKTKCITPSCPDLAAGPRGLCLTCLAKEQTSGSFITPKDKPRDDPLLGGLKKEIMNDKINHHVSMKNLSAQRSVILLKEIRLFSQAVNYVGGGDAPQTIIQNQGAMHNLRNPPDLHLEGTPVIQRMGLRNAVRLTDQVTQVEDINWVIELHKGVVEGTIKPRPIDQFSWNLLKDDSLQSWFTRLRVLRYAIEDPAFKQWTEGVNCRLGMYSITRKPDLAERVKELDLRIWVFEQLYTALCTQPGIRGPTQQWTGPNGLYPPETAEPAGDIGPAIFWNMRILEDACHIREASGKGCTQDAQALFNLKEILLALMNGFESMSTFMRDPSNEDIRNFLNYQMTDVDDALAQGIPNQIADHWRGWGVPVTPWLQDSSWQLVITTIDLWHEELNRTTEFSHAKKIDKDPPPRVEGRERSPYTPRGILSREGVYRRDPSPGRSLGPDGGVSSYMNTIQEALTPFRGARQSREETYQAYLDGKEPPQGPRGGGGPNGPPTPGGGGGRGGGNPRDDRDRSLPPRGGGPPGGEPPGGGPPGGGGNGGNNGGRKFCNACKQFGHEEGDPECPRKMKLCFMCHSTGHNVEDCPHRPGAPPCSWCGKDPHDKLEDCPRYRQEMALQKEAEFKATPFGGLNTDRDYAQWMARQQQGADLSGRYQPDPEPIIYSEVGNELRRRRREEELRAREEQRLTEINQERRRHELARAAIEANEAERVIEARYRANLKEGEQLTQRMRENIIKHGDTVFNRYQELSRQGGSLMKNATLEELEFGADVVFRGDVMGTSAKDFVLKLDDVRMHKGMDDYQAAKLLIQKLRGQARIWVESYRNDPKTRERARSYPELRAAFLTRFERKRDWIDRNRLFRKVRWGPKYRGSHLSLWEDCKTVAFEYLKDWDENKQFTTDEVRTFLASQHFFSIARNGMVMHLMEKGVEDDPIGMEREMKRKEVIIESQSRRTRSQGLEEETPYLGSGKRRLGVNAIEEEDDDGRTNLDRYWDENGCSDEHLEVEALRKKEEDNPGTSGEEPKLCWQCNRPGHVKQNCPELKGDRKKLPGDDGRFRHQEVPGYESDAVKKNWLGPSRTVGSKAAAVKKVAKPRYTRINRSRGSRKPTGLDDKRAYRSRRTKNTYRIAALGSSFIGHENETVGQLDRLIMAGDDGEDVEEEEEEDLQPIFNTSELAELSMQPSHKNRDDEGKADQPEISGIDSAPPLSLSQSEKGYHFETRGDGDSGERYVPFRY